MIGRLAPLALWAALVVALLGFTPDRTSDGTFRGVALTDTQNTSNTTVVLATGLECPVAPNATYVVEVIGHYTSAASTTGIRWRIGDGVADNDGSGAVAMRVRNSAVGTGDTLFVGAEVPGTVTNALGTESAANGATPILGSAVWTTDATPSRIGVYFMSEVSGSAVTVQDGSMIRCTRVR